MIKKEDLNLTMLGIPYVKSKHLNDMQSEKIIREIEYANEFQESCDELYDGFYTRNIISRHHYLTNQINKHSNSFEQLLILSVGLDTKPDTLFSLKNKKCFGLDIAANDIKNIYSYSKTKTKTKILQCDLEKDINSTILEELEQEGMIHSKPSYIVWEGGTFFISKSNVYKVLQYFCSHINIVGCSVDFMSKEVFSPPRHKKANEHLQLMKKIGAPWKSFFSEDELVKMYEELGFTNIDITLHGEYEKKTLGTIKLDNDIMYMTTAVKFSS